MNTYKNIINTKYPFTLKHNRMSVENRASIFSPFSALSGYAESINEAGRDIESKIILEDDKKEIIDYKLNRLKKNNFEDIVKIKYFLKDKSKNGGEYIIINSKIKKVDTYNNQIVLIDKRRLNIDDIFDINI